MSNGQAAQVLRERIDREWRVLDGIQKLIERTDTKASFVLAMDTILAGVFLAHLDALRMVMTDPGVHVLSFWACLVAVAAFIVLLIIGLFNVACVVLPRIGNKDGNTLIFAAHLAKRFNGDLVRLSTAFADHSQEAWVQDVEYQILENSAIAVAKMAHYHGGSTVVRGAAIMWVVAMSLLQMLAPQTL